MRPAERLSQIKAIPFSNSSPRFEIINGRLIGIADNSRQYIDKGYMINDMVYSIVNLILDKIKIPEWGVYKIVDEQKLKRYKSFVNRKDLYGKDYLEAIQLWSKAVEPVESGTKLHDLIERPNPNDTWNQVIANSIGYELLTGDQFMWALTLQAGANEGLPQELYVLPSQEVTIIASNSYPVTELGYSIPQFNLNFTKAQVLHQKRWNPKFTTNGDELYGMSPLKAALMTVNRSNSANEAGAASFQNMGIKGVLYVDQPGFESDQALAQANTVKEKMLTEYTGGGLYGGGNHGKIGTSGYKMGWQSIGLSPVDLNIIESEKWDYQKLCNVYGVPPELMGITQKTYNNAKEAEAALCNRVAMPLLNAKRQALNQKLHTDWGIKDKRIILDFDPSVFTELRMSTKEVAEWTNMMIAITPNEQRTMAYMDAREEPEMDEVMIKTGDRQFLSEYQSNSVDDAINNGAGDEQVPA